jgi:hypothetical protein
MQTGLRLCANFRDKLKESVEEEEETEDRKEQFRQLNMFKRRRQRGEKPAPAPEALRVGKYAQPIDQEPVL